MKRSLSRNCILTAAVLVLPGCLAINAALGILGYLGSGPAQVAGAVYSVSEYTYEYAMNDKTPDEVMLEKISWFIPQEAPPDMSSHAKVIEKPTLSLPAADVKTKVQLTNSVSGVRRARLPIFEKQPEMLPKLTASLTLSRQKTTAVSKPKKVQRQRRVKKQSNPALVIAKRNQAVPASQVVREWKTSPLLTRLDKLELAFRQAENIVSGRPSQGLLLSVQSDGADLPGQGISGSWSIRHHLMNHGPTISRKSANDVRLSSTTNQRIS
ncbi:MAG: hypothetical protein JEY79_16885 [Pseudodesulfovibrio sp.]|nr:hypothetical protein [Pseudodesulfovibrio sp.]